MNNSDITLNFNNDPSLLCFTDHKSCCSSDTALVAGNWYFPNGSIIGMQTASNNIYIERGQSVVGLYWNDNATFPTGIYRCEIPDATGVLHNISVGIILYLAQDATSNSAAVAGAIVGVLLAVVLVIAMSGLIVILQMRK